MGWHLHPGRMAVLKACVAALLLAIGAGCAQADTATARNDGFDALFERASTRWTPQYDWRWLKAQCYQESRFDPRAVSPVGARGLCQFMPGTWAEARQALGVRNIWSAHENAWAAGWYMRRMLIIWTSRRSDHQRLQLAQASYNAGAGHIIAAQEACRGALTWPHIRRCLPQITGRHARETIGYVRQIARWYEDFKCSRE